MQVWWVFVDFMSCLSVNTVEGGQLIIVLGLWREFRPSFLTFSIVRRIRLHKLHLTLPYSRNTYIVQLKRNIKSCIRFRCFSHFINLASCENPFSFSFFFHPLESFARRRKVKFGEPPSKPVTPKFCNVLLYAQTLEDVNLRSSYAGRRTHRRAVYSLYRWLQESKGEINGRLFSRSDRENFHRNVRFANGVESCTIEEASTVSRLYLSR